MKVGARISLFNAKMREARAKVGMTQKELADMVGVTCHQIVLIETMKSPIGGYEKVYNILLNISDCLRKEFDEIFPPDYLFALQEKWLPDKRSLVLFKEIDISELPPFIECLQLPSPEEIIDAEAMERDIKHILDGLPLREASILKLRYGFDGNTPMTREEISTKMGVSGARIFQLEQQALKRFRNPASKKMLQIYRE
jgi:RNA polymerase sigma factor (sigma-70 family)